MHLPSVLRELPAEKREAALVELAQTHGKAAVDVLRGSWRHFWARPEQLAPGTYRAASERTDWTFFCYLAGRGAGKTRAAAEWVIEKARDMPGSHGLIAGPTFRDMQKRCLSYGIETDPLASGILAVSPPDFRPQYIANRDMLIWPNGTTAEAIGAEEPERFRGPNTYWLWADELGSWKRGQASWDLAMMGLRLGDRPQAFISTTPKPIPVLKQILSDPATVVSRGTTYDNEANLAASFYSSIINRYEGTRLGRQELLAELLEDVPGALWTLAQIDALRLAAPPAQLTRIVVAIDPAVTSTESSDETGIVVAGVGPCSCRGGAPEQHGFILEDLSGKYTPNGWAQAAVEAYRRHKADRIVAEANNGGDLVEMAIRTVDPRVAYSKVHASRGKQTRAEPVAALYEQGKVHHCGIVESNGHRTGALVKLEDQMCSWDPVNSKKSPDRMDACVWACTELMLDARKPIAQVGNIDFSDLSAPSRWR